MGRLSRPLNKEAIKKADIEFYQGHPELLKNGKPSPLSVNDPDQAQLCNEWQQLYQKHGGEIETADEQFAAKKPDDPVQPCPLQPKNWIDLEYLYADGQGISGARYQVFDSTTDALLTAGVLNGKGKAHADLPLEVNQVKVRYFNDPAEVETIHESQPQAFLEPSGWFERMTNKIKSSGSWTWGVIQGDFNENPTMAQIATNAVITAIPVVDQVADIRDIVAIVKQMVWEKRNDIATWFALFITVIGLIPTVGSLLKGILKAIWHGAKLGEILKIFNYFKKSNGVKWLKELRAGKLKRYAQQAADNAHKLFDALSEKLIQLKAYVPKAMSDTHKALDDTLSRLGEIKGQINGKFAEIAESLKQKLGKSLDDAGDELSLSNTQTKNTRKQELEEPVSERYNDGGVKNVDGLGRVEGNFSAMNPGPLPNNIADTFAGGKYQVVTLEKDTILSRAGTAGQPLGQFFDLDTPSSVMQTRIDKAILPVWPGGAKSPIDTAFEIKIPAGTKVYVGEVGSQGGAFVGGTQQIVVPKPWTIDGVEVINSRLLK
ncbi:MAG: hypothetical protein L3J75_16610 [Methylococcaceae bacterium]|nr:hypothetical protein [Methylococcaceae bacterium]